MDRMEDVDLVRRIGGRRLVMLRAKAVTSRPRYFKEGYLLKPFQNLAALALYFLGRPVRALWRIFT